MKIAVIGAGNVGALSAMRIAERGLGDVVMVDVAKGLAAGKGLDLLDSRYLLKKDYRIECGEALSSISGSGVVVVTAGVTRKSGMTREELLNKNGCIVKEVCLAVKRLAGDCVLIIVTNPLDLMTRLALEVSGFKRSKVFGMGITLDASRFANLIAEELGVAIEEIVPCVIGSHGIGMLPLPRLTTVSSKPLTQLLPQDKIAALLKRTLDRGGEIVSLLGTGSACFAPSAAVTELVEAVAEDTKQTLGVSAYLDGEYGEKDVCLGVPCLIAREGIEKIAELRLNPEEKDSLHGCSRQLRQQYQKIHMAL